MRQTNRPREQDHEVRHDVRKVNKVVVGSQTSELMGIVKGKRYVALSEHWRNGENHYVIRGLGEIPCVWFDEVDDTGGG